MTTQAKRSTKNMKRAVGLAAANLIQEGMVVGIGSGSTATCFLDALIDRCRHGLSIQAVATSNGIERRAKSGGIPLISLDAAPSVDLAVDGADEIDPKKRMIKGGGGALLREKIVATAADEMIVIIDETKLVHQLGTFGLPLEVVPFGCSKTLQQLTDLGYRAALRTGKVGAPITTDSGNYTVDLDLDDFIDQPEEVDQILRSLPGVIETGFFLGLAGRQVIGYEDGRVEIKR